MSVFRNSLKITLRNDLKGKNVKVKEGNAGIFRLLTTLAPGKTYDLRHDPNATYREYILIMLPDKTELRVLSSDDFNDWKEISIYENKGTYDWIGMVPRRPASVKPPAQSVPEDKPTSVKPQAQSVPEDEPTSVKPPAQSVPEDEPTSVKPPAQSVPEDEPTSVKHPAQSVPEDKPMDQPPPPHARGRLSSFLQRIGLRT